jgi:hypothetical protein
MSRFTKLRRVDRTDWEPGNWVRHVPTKTWFEVYESVEVEGKTHLVGFGLHNEDVVLPLSDCYHAFNAEYDR